MEYVITMKYLLDVTNDVLKSLNVTDEDLQQDIYAEMISQYKTLRFVSSSIMHDLIKDYITCMIKPKNKITINSIKPHNSLTDERKSEVKNLLRAINELDAVHKFVIVNFYGIKEDAMTLEDISTKLGCTMDRLKIIHNEALEQLKELM